MPNSADYKKMYLKIVQETERAINILINAQRECEEIYINACGDEEDKKD